MRTAIPLTLTLALACVAPPVAAQVLVLEPNYAGELRPDDEAALTRALEAGLERGAPGQARSLADTRQQIGDLADCDGDGACVTEIGRTVSASVAVHAEVQAEAEIYDFTVRVYDLATGETLVTQIGDCTFCPVAEALDAFGFTAEAAIAAIDPLPAPTPGPVEPELLATTPVAPEPADDGTTATEPPPEPAPALLRGDIHFDVSVVPDTGTIVVNGESVGTGRVRLELAPQELRVEIRAAGYEPHQEHVTLQPSMAGPIFLRVVLTPDVGQRIVEARPPRRTGSGFDGRAAGGILAGTGLAAAATGIVMLAADGETTCTGGAPSQCANVWEFTAGGTTLTAVGGVALGTGIGLLVASLAGDREDDARADAPARHPAHDAGATLGGRP